MNRQSQPKRGGQPGNQNARKHGFYSKVLTKTDKVYLKEAADINGLDEEINLLRAKLKAVAEHDPDNLRLISLASVSLARLLRARAFLDKDNKDDLDEGIRNVWREFAQPLGITASIVNENGVEKVQYAVGPDPIDNLGR